MIIDYGKILDPQQMEVLAEKPHLSIAKLHDVIDRIRKDHHLPMLFSFSSRDGDSMQGLRIQLELIEQLREYTIFYIREWVKTSERVGFEIDLIKIPYRAVLSLATFIEVVDSMLEGFAETGKIGQLKLFRTFILRGDPTKMNKRMTLNMRNYLNDIHSVWSAIKPDGWPPYAVIFGKQLRRAQAIAYVKEVEKELTTKFSILVRQWSIGSLRDKSIVLSTRLAQICGKLEAKPFNGIMYEAHPTRGVGLMKSKDVMNLPFFSERIVVAENIARFASRPDLLPIVSDVAIEGLDDVSAVIISNGRYRLNLEDYRMACLVTTGLSLQQVVYIPARCLVAIFLQDTDRVLLVGHQIRGEDI